MQKYFKELETKVKISYDIANEARARGFDPVSKVEIPLAANLAEKSLGLISTIYPQLSDKNIVLRILELEKQYGALDMAVPFKIAEEIAKEKFCKFENLMQAIDAGIRVGFAYITLGVVSSPIEGFTELKLGKTKDGKDYFIPYFSGPIRSAGTTASCMVLMLIDYLRETFGYAKYDPDEKEVKRYITENYDYHERVTNLQYLPTEEEIEFLAKNLPIQIAGDPTEEKEVSNYKDLPRVESNCIRGGMCLIFSEGLAQKAQKGFRLYNALKSKGFQITGFDFLDDYIKLHKKREKGSADSSPTYIKDLVAGRPVYSHPSRSGGFRFRYGRSRVSGFSATSVSPMTMAMSNCFLSNGTQLKVEKPTKGCAVTVCDSLDGPIVKLIDGSVRRPRNFIEAKKLYPQVTEILYLGDILFSLGDVINRNYELLKSPYVEEWWELELKKEAEKTGEVVAVDREQVDFDKATFLSEKFKIPLHPTYIYYWTQIDKAQLNSLMEWLKTATLDNVLLFPYDPTSKETFSLGKRCLEILGIEHTINDNRVVLDHIESRALLANLGITKENFSDRINEIIEKLKSELDILSIVNLFSKYKIKDKAGTWIGARMGRPEKAKLRKLIGSPHVLFPVGEEGGRLRSFQAATEEGKIESDFPIYHCEKCQKETIYFICETCGEQTKKLMYCPECMRMVQEVCPVHGGILAGKVKPYMKKRIEIKGYIDSSLKQLRFTQADLPALIKGVRGTTSSEHAIEHLSKGILRAKYGLHVNKDGTIRYDATELPITHFKQKEVGTSIGRLIELGYSQDIEGKPLENGEQILELKPHDIILPSCPDSDDEKADTVFMNMTRFIDSLLVRFYNLKPFYELKSKDELAGQLTVCMAPHNCAGVITRIVGFSKVQGILATPYVHAAVRRDCLGYNSYVTIKDRNGWKIVKIGDFVENLRPEERADNYGTLKKKIDNFSCWSNTGKTGIKEVTKHSPREMIRLTLEDGREIELTENHRVYLKGKEEKEARNLKEGDRLSISYKKEVEEKDMNELFLPEIFKGREDVMIRNVRAFLESFEKLDKASNYYQRDSFPIKLVEELLQKDGKSLKDIPSEARISAKRDNVLLPLRVILDKELLEIFGLYLAEGYSRSIKEGKGLNQVYIASNEKELRDFIEKVFLSHFGLKPTENKEDRVTFSSRILYELFIDYLGMGSKAKDKRIPAVFLDLKKEKIASLLRGYFEGDGSVSLTDTRVVCDSVSEGLKHDLNFVLSRFGIFTKFYDYEKEPGPQVKEFYIKKGRIIPKFRITKIIIPSDFVKKFSEIGFLSERKSNILKELCKKNPIGMRIDSDENYAYPKIRKIEQIGEKESYCLNVEKEHNFFANDILVHNCDGDEVAVMLLLDVLINFSRKFLPAHRGGTQDAPLVLNSRINAGEVDDQILDFELGPYPLELYELSEKGEHSSKIFLDNVKNRLKAGVDPFTNVFFTHNTIDINGGVVNSAYKAIPTMEEKVQKQMELAEKIRAVDVSDVARLVIERHFIRDIRGNLRKFSTQEFRCVGCNKKFRRPPLVGKCTACGGKIIFTISEGSIMKYMAPALALARKYDVSNYIKQNLELTQKYIESIFGRETEKQAKVSQWF